MDDPSVASVRMRLLSVAVECRVLSR